MEEKLFDRITETVKEYNMLDGVSTVLVGLSGGADSVLLLRYLHMLTDLKVYAVHVNHLIRGEEARRDEAFCVSLCNDLGIKCFVRRVDIPELARAEKEGIEEAARKYRYKIYEEICLEYSIDKVATGHNLDDNFETFIFHLSRGSSARGLCGISPVNNRVIRPLIKCSKKEIIDFCNYKDFSFVFDSTNNDDLYSRNFIRNNVSPLFSKLNKSYLGNFSKTVDMISSDCNYLDEVASRYSFDDGRTVLAGIHDSLLSRVLVRELNHLLICPEYVHISEIIRLLRSDRTNFSFCIPGGRFICERDYVFAEANVSSAEEKKVFPIHLHKGKNLLSDNEFLYFSYDDETDVNEIRNLENIYNLSTSVRLNCDKIKDGLFLRHRKNGDRYYYGSINRKVKKILQSKKIPNSQKEKLPVITAFDDTIIWIPGFPANDLYVGSDSGGVMLYYFADKRKDI